MTRDDGAALEAMVAALSERSRYLRFHGPMPELRPDVRRRLLDLDGRDRTAIIAEARTGEGWQPVGFAQLARTGPVRAELAVAVVDHWQRRGVGGRLLAALEKLAAELGYTEVCGDVLPENDSMIKLAQRAFLGARMRWDDGVVRVCGWVGPAGADSISDADILADLLYR